MRTHGIRVCRSLHAKPLKSLCLSDLVESRSPGQAFSCSSARITYDLDYAHRVAGGQVYDREFKNKNTTTWLQSSEEFPGLLKEQAVHSKFVFANPAESLGTYIVSPTSAVTRNEGFEIQNQFAERDASYVPRRVCRTIRGGRRLRFTLNKLFI